MPNQKKVMRRKSLPDLTVLKLKLEARQFLQSFSGTPVAHLYSTRDGKTIGTYVEQEFKNYLSAKYLYERGNAASGIDFPQLGVDLKVTSITQPQSSCPYRDASQKVYGLGYDLLVFTYEKFDDHSTLTAKLNFKHAIFVERQFTGDFQTTSGLQRLLDNDGNKDDLIAFLEERNLPLDEIGRNVLAERVLENPPVIGYLTISNAQQWRLQYGRVITVASERKMKGVDSLLE